MPRSPEGFRDENERQDSHLLQAQTIFPKKIIFEEKQGAVKSAECFGCMTCISVCPSEGALAISFRTGRKRDIFSPYLYPALLILLFSLIIGAGITTGKWNSQLTYEEYRRLIPETSKLTHPSKHYLGPPFLPTLFFRLFRIVRLFRLVHRVDRLHHYRSLSFVRVSRIFFLIHLLRRALVFLHFLRASRS